MGGFSGGDGARHPVVGAVRLDRALLPKPGNARPPVGVERMLRIYVLRHWFNLSDPAVEEVVYDSQAMRRFVGIDLGHEPVPDETTVCRFCNLLETHDPASAVCLTRCSALSSPRTADDDRYDCRCNYH